eukprot:767537-Hanusia_phi.AAC.4
MLAGEADGCCKVPSCWGALTPPKSSRAAGRWTPTPILLPSKTFGTAPMKLGRTSTPYSILSTSSAFSLTLLQILPTNGGAWQDQGDPSGTGNFPSSALHQESIRPYVCTVGYAFKGRGSVTAANGWTGYYDTTLHDGADTEVLPDETVNDAMGWDAALSGTNTFWGNRGGKNSRDPAAWHKGEPLTIAEFSDSDYVPYGFVCCSCAKER